MAKAAKKVPQSIYLNEIVHSRVSRLVENALDGHGSIAGFFSFLEKKAFEAFADCKVNVQDSLPPLPPVFYDPDIYARDEHGDYLLEMDFGRYVSAWDAEGTNSRLGLTARHLLSLFTLRDHKHLWIAESYEDYVTKHEPASTPHTISEHPLWKQRDVRYLTEQLCRYGRGELTDEVSLKQPLKAFKRGQYIIHFDPHAQSPQSMYLDPQQHQFFYNVFGNKFFAFAERALQQVLGFRPLNLPAEYSVIFGFDTAQIAILLELGSDLYRLKHGNSDMDEEIDWWATSYASLLDFDTNDLANLLRLTCSKNNPITPGDIIAAMFVNVFGLDTLLPDRTALFSILQQKGIALDANEDVGGLLPDYQHNYLLELYDSNVVVYHLFQLFKQYALEALPEAQRSRARVTLGALVHLAQYGFSITETLEDFSATNVEKTPARTWQFKKGRKLLLELSNEDAYHVATLLSLITPTRDNTVLMQELQSLAGKKRKVQLNTSPHVIERFRALVRDLSTQLQLPIQEVPPETMEAEAWKVFLELVAEQAGDASAAPAAAHSS